MSADLDSVTYSLRWTDGRKCGKELDEDAENAVLHCVSSIKYAEAFDGRLLRS